MVLCIGTFNVYKHVLCHCAVGRKCGFGLWFGEPVDRDLGTLTYYLSLQLEVG